MEKQSTFFTIFTKETTQFQCQPQLEQPLYKHFYVFTLLELKIVAWEAF